MLVSTRCLVVDDATYARCHSGARPAVPLRAQHLPVRPGFLRPARFAVRAVYPYLLLLYSYGTDLILPAWTNRRLRHLLVTGAGTRQEWERTPEEEQQLAMSLVLATENAHVPEVMEQ